MQTLSWYVRRLRAMSAHEILWRVRSVLRDSSDRYRIPLRVYPGPLGDRSLYPQSPAISRWCPIPVAHWRGAAQGSAEAAWRDLLIARADAIAAHRFTFFDLDHVDVGRPVRWNRDHAGGIDTPVGLSAAIDYRNYGITGDAKVVWEPNRHHHLVVLARAYRATGRVEYAVEIAGLLESWLDQCPFGHGMNWRSPLELAVRVINWVWALDLIVEASVLTVAVQRRLLHAVRLHVWDIARKYSRGSSANNHLIGEACGVFIATTYFNHLPEAAARRQEARAILHREILAQTYPSGATREQAFGYHLFVLQFFVYAALAGRWSGDDFDGVYWDRLERMFDFADALAEGGPFPTYGDADDGYVLDLGSGPRDVAALRALRRWLFPRTTNPGVACDAEVVHWLFGAASPRAQDSRPRPLQSRAFEDAGCYLLQWGEAGAADTVSVLFDCGELGFTTLAAHGHADALSFTVRAFGADVFVDPGTYDYFTYPEWRRYFRSTPAHNTVAIDGEDQSVLFGSFLWGRRAVARRLSWQPVPGGGSVAGEHDGYTRLPDPVMCRRRIDLKQASRTLDIEDEIVAEGAHRVEVFFHLSERCDVRQAGREIAIELPEGAVTLLLDDLLDVTMVKGGTPHEGGWVSDGYHRKTPSWTIIGRMQSSGPVRLRTTIAFHPPARGGVQT